ncbi:MULTISPECIES: aminotransferase class V-fold PLP-dependent enzyme [unclassified Saccharibacter]|uniref:aminotransferase class V-fold PLP-dependent enzyme n=1 Tax=unclassified Saccharibacter TaxID=2648722 RepID=UPI001324099C|nr:MULTISPECIES: cysteine desulfurase [unclassified Saccharibacter]MXV35440.1 SufS family cysteine desulfurase [Saccharibacter sp. EH611]MXV58100.1 SufS family cysteine desulfurase [Saccharibacter sp. EH70]MXV65374.1 SufS family cysteine desulfurase [Saccharibacter sp. EH60]
MNNDVRACFPILSEKVHGRPLVYLDSAASAQKPNAVIDAMSEAARHCYANIHRGLHAMSERTTVAYEAVRQDVARFINAPSAQEVFFTKNSTEGFNFLAHTLGERVKPGQAIVLSELEHHANIVPWLMLRERTGVELRIVPIKDDGDLDLDAYEQLLSDGKVALVSITHMSNVLGTITPAKHLAERAHHYGATIIFDASQSIVHQKLDVQESGADFIVFTGHKLYGPTGVGAVWGRAALLEELPPFMGGGEMIRSVSFDAVSWADIPHRFEAGTPPILEVIGLGAAIRFVEGIGHSRIEAHEKELLAYGTERLSSLKGMRILGAPAQRGGVLSFVMEGAHPHDLAVLLDKQGIAVRAGQHCAEPLLTRLGLHATTRASFGLYTSLSEIDALVEGLERAHGLLT